MERPNLYFFSSIPSDFLISLLSITRLTEINLCYYVGFTGLKKLVIRRGVQNNTG